MRKLNYFIVGLSQLIMGTMTIGFVSCEQNLEALDNSPQMAEAMVGSKSITSNDSICLFSNTDSLKKPQTRANLYYPEMDEYYSSNMWAIRELPFSLKVRGAELPTGLILQPKD